MGKSNRDGHETWCYSFEDDGPNAKTVLGATWMMHQDIVFDLAQQRLGIVQANCPVYKQRPPHFAMDAGCVDQNVFCADWTTRGECSKNPDFMLLVCKKSCNACKEATVPSGMKYFPMQGMAKNSFCGGPFGSARKKLVGAAMDSVDGCALAADRDDDCGRIFYFATAKDGVYLCRCVMLGQDCTIESPLPGSTAQVYEISMNATGLRGANQ